MRRNLTIASGLAGLAGLAGMVVLTACQDLVALRGLLVGVGWGIVPVTIAHVAPLALSALAWHRITQPVWPGSYTVFLWARFVREAVSNLLPAAEIGSHVIGARVLTLHGARAGLAGASVLVDLTVEFLTQIAFVVVGLLLLLAVTDGGEPVRWVLLGLAVAVVVAAGFLLAQRAGMFALFESLLDRMAKRLGLPVLGSLAGLHKTAMSIYRCRRALAAATSFQLISWLLGGAETWLILHFLDADVGFSEALIIESLGQAVRSAAFLVPGALGIQEGGFIVLGVMFGLAPEVGLSVSLIKRFRDAVLGVPALLAWQVIEGRRLFEPTVGAEDKQR